MPTLEERVAYLEGQVSDHSQALGEVREAVRHPELRMDARFESVDRRFETVDRRIEAGFEAVDRRFEGVDRKIETGFEAVARRFDTIDRRIDGLDTKLSSHFVWLVGILVTVLVAIVAALLARP